MKIFKYLFKVSDPKYDFETYEQLSLDESIDSSTIDNLNNMFCLKVDKRMTDYTELLNNFIKNKYGLITLHIDCMKPSLYKPAHVHTLEDITQVNPGTSVIQPNAKKAYSLYLFVS